MAIGGEVQLLNSNGTLVGGVPSTFTNLKALTFDNIRHQFLVSDMEQDNDTIYSVPLKKENTNSPIIQDLPDDIRVRVDLSSCAAICGCNLFNNFLLQGLAIDPLLDDLYWTDKRNKTINYVNLNDPTRKIRIFKTFVDAELEHLTIDSCRRYSYITLSHFNLKEFFYTGSYTGRTQI